MIRLVLADDQQVVRLGFRMILDSEPDMEVVGEAANGVAAIAAAVELQPDVILTDVRMPMMDGIAATKAIVERCPDVRVLIVTTCRTLPTCRPENHHALRPQPPSHLRHRPLHRRLRIEDPGVTHRSIASIVTGDGSSLPPLRARRTGRGCPSSVLRSRMPSTMIRRPDWRSQVRPFVPSGRQALGGRSEGWWPAYPGPGPRSHRQDRQRLRKEILMRISTAPATDLTIEVEDAGHTSMLRSMFTMLAGHGTQFSRFVARTADASEPPAVVTTSWAFPVSPLALRDGQDVAPDGGWPDEARAALEELDAMLVADGWQCTATGPRWWQRRYTRAAG